MEGKVNSFTKIINPCLCETAKGEREAYAKIRYDGHRLSIVGETNSGVCGQCVDEIRDGIPHEEWSEEMLKKFCDIWGDWHLNDMRPCCSHQKKLGWNELALKKVNKFNFHLTYEAFHKKEEIKNTALKTLEDGKSCKYTEEQRLYSMLPYSKHVYSYDESVPAPLLYQSDKNDEMHRTKEKITLGRIHPDEFEDGILTKECPVCGYKYGTRWLTEDVPEDVLTWLKELPDSEFCPRGLRG